MCVKTEERESIYLCVCCAAVLSFCSKSIIQLQLQVDSDFSQLNIEQKHGIDKQSLIPFSLLFKIFIYFFFFKAVPVKPLLKHIINQGDILTVL